MKYISTNFKSKSVSFQKAILKGLAPDGGLYMPENIPLFTKDFFKEKRNYHELAFEMIKPYIGEEIDNLTLKKMCKSAFNFPVTVVNINSNINILELFHGPTLAFKDFAARFMARSIQYFIQNKKDQRVVLVATSGDTGSAVANGFYKVDGIKVYILYPSGRVSKIQEKQLTTLGENIRAIEVEGSFDDCQKIVKTAFMDKSLKNNIKLSSANSINIARLLPQSIYYAWIWKKLGCINDIIVSVPSGNFGNITGGLIAKKMGLPITNFIASVNANNIFPIYLKHNKYFPKSSISTISNAMDVGNPSNFSRIKFLYNSNINKIRKDIKSNSVNDIETKNCIFNLYEKFGYLADPHTAVGVFSLEKIIKPNQTGVVLSTAHPAKFADIIETVLDTKVDLPKRLKELLEIKKDSVKIKNNYNNLKSILLDENL